MNATFLLIINILYTIIMIQILMLQSNLAGLFELQAMAVDESIVSSSSSLGIELESLPTVI